ncbi:GNAT family N-acetyltransferase [Fictibacillus aquaticus]|uniref:N-acetyltransferase domain-containing protein n=1 Tax=Fictibacillus aquaticus TaxID=2021314 RepID=A0A235F876_9BACL|nr:GNAT family N-acetyltransferase [Fictibacillus aquaticus]OYD57264.1 hypothetical protein CGZ90_11280 [Fictibacillus aquaticus]
MRVECLTREKVPAFKRYCQKHIQKLDQSYITVTELDSFQPDEKNPTYVAFDENGEMTAAASLIINSSTKARFRIFHSDSGEPDIYKQLFDAMQKHTQKLNYVYLFTQETETNHRQMLESAGFEVERYSYVLAREPKRVLALDLPDGCTIVPFVFDRDEELFCEVRNAAFAQHPGNETLSSDIINQIINSAYYLEGGMMLLKHNDRAVGAVRVEKEMENGEQVIFISSLSVLPEYQGKGLGRQLLRACLQLGEEKGIPKAMLCVDSQNDRAAQLYEKEGFEKIESYVCLGRTVPNGKLVI